MAGLDHAAGIARFTADQVEDALVALRRDGVVAFDNLWSEQRIAELHAAMAQHYPAYVATDDAMPSDHFGVGERRFLSPVSFAPPFDCADILLHPAIEAVYSALLSDDYVIEAFGVICARPGADEQHVHRDAGAMYSSEGLDWILPPPAMAMYCPLVPVMGDNGATGFWLGSHRKPGRPEDSNFVTADLPLGSAVVWDMRTYHHGRPYHEGPTRAVLYQTVCRPFWIDHVNFVPGRNAKLLASRAALKQLDERQRRRFIRAEFSG